MTRIGILFLAGCLAWPATCWADDNVDRIVPVSASEPMPAETAGPAPGATETMDTAAVDCVPATQASGLLGGAGRFRPTGEFARRAWDWLTYFPQSCPRCCSGCGRTCAPTCVPPLYTYFLWHCDAGCGAAGCQASSMHGADLAPARAATAGEQNVPPPQ